MRSHQAGELMLAETAASAGTTSERAQALLEDLRRFTDGPPKLQHPVGNSFHH